MSKKYTTDIFIEKAREVHGDKYDYSKVEYEASSKKVCIVCRKHGTEFWQAPNSHLAGHGCPTCALEYKSEITRFSNEQFLYRAQAVWGNRFDLSTIVYTGHNNKITVRCRTHGDFLINPHNFLQGQGCPKCKSDNAKNVIYGVGVNDLYSSSKTKVYTIWRNILTRCYDERELQRHPTYRGCELCDEWRLFSNFKKWADEHYRDGYEIEKDIIKKHNKVYGPETCCFVPRRINILLTRRQRYRGILPVGVTLSESGKRFRASIDKDGKTCLIGYYGTPEEAFYAYKAEKEAYLKDVAQEYYNRGEIDKRVYDALMRYEIEITD